jgi:beta-glucanase (GH16 family)
MRLTRAFAAVVVSLATIAFITLPATSAQAGKPDNPGKPPKPSGPSCGSTIQKPNGSPWECTFDEEFSSSTLDDRKWVVQTTEGSNFHGGGDCFMDSPNNVSIANGVLSLTTRKEAAPFTCTSPGDDYTTQYTSGMIMTYGKFSQVYGRFEIRAKFPAIKVAGIQAALWLWPDNPVKYGLWPASGEIDIAEWYSLYYDRVIPFVHYLSADPYDTSVTNNYCLIDATNYHNYVAEWTQTKVTITFDGKTCVDHTIDPASPLSGSQPFDHPFMIALTQALGVGANAVTSATPLPATTQVDYVRVWK